MGTPEQTRSCSLLSLTAWAATPAEASLPLPPSEILATFASHPLLHISFVRQSIYAVPLKNFSRSETMQRILRNATTSFLEPRERSNPFRIDNETLGSLQNCFGSWLDRMQDRRCRAGEAVRHKWRQIRHRRLGRAF